MQLGPDYFQLVFIFPPSPPPPFQIVHMIFICWFIVTIANFARALHCLKTKQNKAKVTLQML